MRVETIRMIADWLKRSDFGINHFIPLVPQDQEDGQVPLISTYKQDEVAVFDETRHLWVVERKPSPVRHSLYIMAEGPLDFEGHPTPNGEIRDTVAPLVVIVRYITENSNRLQAHTHAEAVLRAGARSLKEFMENAYAADHRIRNFIHLIEFQDPFVFMPVYEKLESHSVTGALGLQCHVRDQNPSFT